MNGLISRGFRLAPVAEAQIVPGAPLAGQPIGAAGLPPGCVIVSVRRDGADVTVSGDTVLMAGDLVTALTTPETAGAFSQLARGTAQQAA